MFDMGRTTMFGLSTERPIRCAVNARTILIKDRDTYPNHTQQIVSMVRVAILISRKVKNSEP